MNNIPFEEEKTIPMWAFPSSQRRKRSLNDQFMSVSQSRDAKYAFLETGFIVMTDFVSLDHKKTMRVVHGTQALTYTRSPTA